ncbi:Hypothetical predicted protein [Paramuricea clavata]|uniref:Uncharacterized protein n=1 Tax=Paramuricea clavata TaxID=317549 RepID=A0A6S7LB82_PARCT|nr:Hypothetical predicted protein [Paramuricea clavata]
MYSYVKESGGGGMTAKGVKNAKSIQRLIEQGRPEPEVVKAGGIFETAYERVLSKHEVFAILVEEEDYEQEEEWMEDVSKEYDAICIINDYKITTFVPREQFLEVLTTKAQ